MGVAWLVSAVLVLSGHHPGRLVEGTFYAPDIRGTERYQAWLPAGYDLSGLRYPVIYALHGLPTDEEGYLDMDVRALGAAAERVGHPAIVVAPQGARKGDTDPEWHNWGPGRDWENLIAEEVVHHVDRTYRTVRGRRGRAIIGVSAGGYGATIIAVHHPQTYSAVESWSGYFHPTDPVGNHPLDLGTPEADQAASVHAYVYDAQNLARYRPSYFGFYIGDEDPHFVAENVALHVELQNVGVRHDFAIYPGTHSAAFWAEHEDDWIARAARRLEA